MPETGTNARLGRTQKSIGNGILIASETFQQVQFKSDVSRMLLNYDSFPWNYSTVQKKRIRILIDQGIKLENARPFQKLSIAKTRRRPQNGHMSKKDHSQREPIRGEIQWQMTLTQLIRSFLEESRLW